MSGPRLLLVEFLTTRRLYQRRSELFPLVRGFAEAAGIPVRWLAFGVDPEHLASAFRMQLGDDEPALLQALREHRPTHVLLNEELESALEARVREAAGGARLEVCGLSGRPDFEVRGNLEAWLGLAAEAARAHERLTESVDGIHSCELANALAKSLRPFVQVLGGPVCYFRLPIARNPFYAGLDVPEDQATGCAFCERGPARYPYRLPPETVALRQIRAALATCPPERFSGEFLLRGSAVFLRIERFFAQVLERHLPPSAFYFFCRIDEVRRRADRIEALLPALDAAGHSINLFAMGVENFSLDENTRLNKGLSDADIDAVFERIVRWEREHPSSFRFTPHGGFSFILFTPWTTLADLRTNLARAGRYRFAPDPFFFTSRLQLFEPRAVTLLARHDGLVAERFEDPAFAAYDSGCIGEASQVEVPWRFAHPEVAAVYGVCIRLFPLRALPAGDPLTARVRRLVARLPRGAREPFRLLSVLVSRAEGPPPCRSTAELLDRVEPLADLLGFEPDPDEVAARASAAAREREALRGRLTALLERLSASAQRPLAGWRPRSVAAAPGPFGWGELHAVLERDGARLALVLVPRGAAGPGMRTSAHFGLKTAPDTPLDTAEKKRVAAVIVTALEHDPAAA